MKKIAITLREDELARYKALALNYDTSFSALISALSRHASGLLESGDADVKEMIIKEAHQRTKRRSDAGKKGMISRWGDKEEED